MVDVGAELILGRWAASASRGGRLLAWPQLLAGLEYEDARRSRTAAHMAALRARG